MAKLYSFTVQGIHVPPTGFPLEMLNLDCCWPATVNEAKLIDEVLQTDADTRYGARTVAIRFIGICSPDVNRWEKRGWKVTEVK